MPRMLRKSGHRFSAKSMRSLSFRVTPIRMRAVNRKQPKMKKGGLTAALKGKQWFLDIRNPCRRGSEISDPSVLVDGRLFWIFVGYAGQKSMPPMPPPGIAGAGASFFGASATMASVVIRRPATEAAS